MVWMEGATFLLLPEVFDCNNPFHPAGLWVQGSDEEMIYIS